MFSYFIANQKVSLNVHMVFLIPNQPSVSCVFKYVKSKKSNKQDNLPIIDTHLFYKNKLYKNIQAKICPKIKNKLRTLTRLKF